MTATKNNPFNALDSEIGTQRYPWDAWVQRELRRNSNRLTADLGMLCVSNAYETQGADDGQGPDNYQSHRVAPPPGTWTAIRRECDVRVPPGTTTLRLRLRANIPSGENLYVFPVTSRQPFRPGIDPTAAPVFTAAGAGSATTYPTSGTWDFPVRPNASGIVRLAILASSDTENVIYKGVITSSTPSSFQDLESGTFGNLTETRHLRDDYFAQVFRTNLCESAWQYNGSTYSDVTTGMTNTSQQQVYATVTSAHGANFATYWGFLTPPRGMLFERESSTAGSTVMDVSWRYYNGSTFTDLSMIDQDIDDFDEAAGTVNINYWEEPDDWTVNQPDSSMPELYWVQSIITAHTSTTTPAELKQAFGLTETVTGYSRIAGSASNTTVSLARSGALSNVQDDEDVYIIGQGAKSWIHSVHVSANPPPPLT